MDTDQRLEALESMVHALSSFTDVDPEIAGQLMTFWFVVFITGFSAGAIARYLGKR